MNRRGFLGSLVAVAGGLVLPYEPERVYSFLPGERRRWLAVDKDFVCRKIRQAASEIETLHARIAKRKRELSEPFRWVVKSATREGVITVGLERAEDDFMLLAGDHMNFTAGDGVTLS